MSNITSLEPRITQERLKELLSYDPATGQWFWNQRRGGTAHKDCEAGWIERSTGYRRIAVCGKKEYAHRLAFIWMTGNAPVAHVDHKDGNPANCRWENIRQATVTENMANKRIQTTNKLGVKGVRLKNGKFEVRVSRERKLLHRSVHETLEAARLAYAAASVSVFGEFARVQ